MKMFVAWFLVASLFAGALAGTGRTGIQLIGLQAVADDQVDVAGDILSKCPANHDCELHFLAYSFTQGAMPDVHSVSDFSKAERLIKRVLPKLTNNQKLFVTASLDDGPNRASHSNWVSFKRGLSVANFWQKVKNNDVSFKADWQAAMVKPYADWAGSMLNWAVNNGYANRLRLVVVPVLEDRCDAGWAYQRLMGWTTAGLPSGIGVRRNSVLAGADRIPGATMEFHTFSSTVTLQAGDAISNDGNTVNGDQWRAAQTNALRQNASALLWRTEFNGNRNAVPPSQRGILRPFDDPGKITSMIGWITYRPNGY